MQLYVAQKILTLALRKLKGWKKIFHENGNQKKAGVAIIISNKIGFK